MKPRRHQFWTLYDFSVGHGLELGPLNRPMVDRDQGDVSYLDVLDRDGIIEQYRDDPLVVSETIPEIHYVLTGPDGQTRSLVEAVKPGAPFDWVVASHVIEHVPDVIGWLKELAEVVVDDGALVLAVPDRRYCFDVHRPPTTVGQMLGAHAVRDVRPAPSAVYDFFAGSVGYDLAALWRGELPTYSQRIHSLDQASAHFDRALAGEYIDCHVWLFSPDSFLQQMNELRRTGQSEWVVTRMDPTRHNDLEFHAVLRRIPRTQDSTAEMADEVTSDVVVPDWLPDTTAGARADRLERRVTRLEGRLARRDATLRKLRRRLRRRRRELERLKAARSQRLTQTLRRRLRRLRRPKPRS
jgi:SAM-dependent methyltransferase